MRILPLFFLIISVSMILVFASIETFTLFSGSHSSIDISSPENDILCVSCHSKIVNELSNSSIHSDFSCEECHRLSKTSSGKLIEYAVHNASGIYPGNQSHAAYTPKCLDCHGGNGIYYNDTWIAKQAPPAKAFNELDYGSDYSAHKSFVEYSSQSGLSVGENEACIACHTNYSMKFEYNYFWNISYSMSGWVINSFSYNGTRNYVVNYQKTGAKHEFLNKTDIECTKCHENIYEALVNGTSNPDNEDYLTHAPIEINHGTDLYAWDIKNCWGNYRYHYISPGYREEDVKTNYCIECHNIAWYSEEFPSSAIYYDLSGVVDDTNSSYVHAAEIVSCATCHGNGKTKWASCADHEAKNFVNYVASNYPRNANGDICMSCHEAAVHPDDTPCSSNCHSQGGLVDYAYVYSEPSGYVINSNSGEFTLSQQCEETWERTTDDGITINFSLGVNSFIWTFDKSGTSSKSVFSFQTGCQQVLLVSHFKRT